MLAKTPINQRFYNWVAAQDPNEIYNYQNCEECPCAVFLVAEMGHRLFDVRMARQSTDWVDNPSASEVNLVWNRFDTIARGNKDHTDWTFGKLRRRIEETMPECVA